MSIPKLLKNQQTLTRHWLQLTVGLGLSASFLLIVQAWILANIVNEVVFDQALLAEMWGWLWWLPLIFGCRALLTWASEQTAFRIAAQIKHNLRNQLHTHLQALGPIQSAHTHSGSHVNTLVDGIEALEDYYSRYLPAMSWVVLVPMAVLIFVFPLDWISGLVLLVTAPIIPFFMIMIGKSAEKLNKKQWRQLARMSIHFLDMIQGLTTLKIFNASRREATLIASISDEYRRTTMPVLRVAFLSSLLLEFFASIGIAIVAVLIGFRLLHGDTTFLPGFFVLLLAPDFYLPLRNMGSHYHARMAAIGAVEQMIEILNKPVHSQPNKKNNSHLSPLFLDKKAMAISFKQVSFSYEKGRQALADFTLHIEDGTRVTLVGASGAGKSTVANLLLGFIQTTHGTITVDNIDLKTISRKLWRQQIGWLPQRPYLFYGTIAQNICLGNQQATTAEIEQAATFAHCADFISRLPDGYNTHLGEHGAGLSGGQIQRIALARAFLKDAPLLILDEAAAGLDPDNEQLIQQTIEQLTKNRTVITIAHRLHSMKQAAQIVMIKKGRVVDTGTHQQLQTRNQDYKEMVATI